MATIQKTLHGNMTDRRSEGKNTHMRLSHSQSLVTCTLIALLVSTLALLFGPVPRASAYADGYVYVLNNDLSGSNSITVFNRGEDGSLKQVGTTTSGGLGSLTAFADGIQGSLILTRDKGSRLFAAERATKAAGCLLPMQEATRFPSSMSLLGISL